MTGWSRRLLGRYLPAHFEDPLGLAGRLLRSRSPDAWFAAWSALVGAAATPFDLLLRTAETGLYRRAKAPERPILLVVGPPRSGTTLVAQTLIRTLPVTYFNNVTAIFPRSPITANRLLGRIATPHANARVRPRSYYGRTARLFGPNDGLQLWDRWLGSDRTVIPTQPAEIDGPGLSRFFGAWEEAFDAPVLNKNNNLNLCASLISEVLPTARFICLDREPIFLAQSLLQARRQIHGSSAVPYGLHDPARSEAEAVDPLEDICRQVRFHRETARRHQRSLGEARFKIQSYEDFCRDPAAVVERVASEFLGRPADREKLSDLRPFEASRRRSLPADEFARLEALVEPAAGLSASLEA